MRASPAVRSLTRQLFPAPQPLRTASLRVSTALSTALFSRSAFPAAPTPCRCFRATAFRSQQYTIGDLDDKAYQSVSDRAMDSLTEYLEEKLEDLEGDTTGFDVEYSVSTCGKSGVLTVNLGDKGTYVINKQPPNKQIWLSSPISGPKRYDYDVTHNVWFYHRNGELMHDLLNRELRELLGDETITVELGEEEEA
ncbi:hypothetical protein JCM1841_005491 [Sporobolomyces salmonicolor]